MDVFIYLALIGLAAGLVKGISGFGSSLVALPLLLLLFPGQQIGITTMLITFNVILNVLLLFENKGYQLSNIKRVFPITLTGVIFTIIGISLLKNINPSTISYIALGLLIFAILIKLYHMYFDNPIHLKPSLPLQVVVGAMSGFGNGIAAIDGPPVVFYLTGTNADKVTFKNTFAMNSLVMGIIGMITLLINKLYTTEFFVYTIALVVFTSIGLFIGMLISKKLNEKAFNTVVVGILLALVIKILFF